MNAAREWKEFWTSVALLAVLGAGIASYRARPALESRARSFLARLNPPPPAPPAPAEGLHLLPKAEEAAPLPSKTSRHTEVLSASPDGEAPEGNVFRLKGSSRD